MDRRGAARSRDAFAATFLSFPEPFTDREEFLDGLHEFFDTIEVLLHDDRAEFDRLTTGPDGHALLGAGLLIPIRYSQWRALDTPAPSAAGFRSSTPYSPETGLELGRAERRAGAAAPPTETVL